MPLIHVGMLTAMRSFIRSLPLLICLPALSAAGATPAEALLGPLLGEFTGPQLRCEWIGAHSAGADRTLSLYRDSLSRLEIRLDGAPLAATDTGALILAMLEQNREGTTGVSVELDARRLSRRFAPIPGNTLEVGLVDASGVQHPLFCGPVVATRSDTGSARVALAALQVTPGSALRRKRTFSDMKRVDVIEQVANEQGLSLEVVDDVSRPTFARLVQNGQADWTFLRALARADAMELTLTPDPRLSYRQSSFSPPPAPVVSRLFSDMSWIEVIGVLAGELGLQLDIAEVETFPVMSFSQQEPDLAFAHRLAVQHGRSVFLGPGMLRIRNDGMWLAPGLEATPAAFRILITAARQSAGYRRTPGRPPDIDNVVLSLGAQADSPALSRPLITLPMHTSIDAADFRAALRRVQNLTGSSARERFLSELASVHEPVLLIAWQVDDRTRSALKTVGRIESGR